MDCVCVEELLVQQFSIAFPLEQMESVEEIVGREGEQV